MNILIVEDEQNVRFLLKGIINSINELTTKHIFEAGNIKDTINIIKDEKIDLLLLDIHLPDGTGFDLLEKFPNPDFKLIFITAYDKFAVKAFKYSAIDFILKPIDPEELEKSVLKAKEEMSTDELSTKINALFENIKNEKAKSKKVILKTAESIFVVHTDEITRCKADKTYTEIYLTDDRTIIVSKTLKDFENLLEELGFIRVHQSHLINTKYIYAYNKSEGGYILMRDKSQIPVSLRKKKQIAEIIAGLYPDTY